MTPEEREALRRAAEEATPGPWRRAEHPKAVRIVREAIRHLFPPSGDGDTADGWSDAYAVVAALHADALLAPTLTEEERRLRDRLHQRTMDGYEDGYAEVYVVTDDLHDALAIIDRLSGSTSTGGPT